MPRTIINHPVSKCGNTKVVDLGTLLRVYLYDTCIVTVHRRALKDGTPPHVTYCTGGFDTPTTIRRMQQAAIEYRLPSPPSLADWRKMSVDEITIPL